MACHPDKMTAVHLAEAALAAHKTLIEGHKEDSANKAAAFAARRFRAGGYDFDPRGVQMALGIHPSGKKLAFKFLPNVRAQFEAQWAENKADYDSWMKEAKETRESDLAKLAELEDALAHAKAEEVLEKPSALEVWWKALKDAEAEDEERICAELARLAHERGAYLASKEAYLAVLAGDSEEADDAFNPPGLCDREAWMKEGKKMPEAESWADAADDDDATKQAESLAKSKRMFALTTPGKSYAAAARA